jgi:putative membrane protein
MKLLLRFLLIVPALWAAVYFVPGISFEGDWLRFLGVAAVFTLLNVVVRPVLKLLSLPLILVTLGLFIFIINGLMIWLTSSVSASLGLGFHVSGFLSAFLGALVVSVVSTLLHLFVK